ncbi:hypothetical protein M1105_15060 [Limibaculum sp. FT325]|uniref:ATP-grasp domain-containing protein n=1 Tax=Thermohalobaculum sediminis TaxID=2939436 RepID=UPI0020C00CCC|nr:hypothetical protein [Limibaculum sediminis]MCL5778302.1 hypothetical protein [Limibaculum sediminis]
MTRIHVSHENPDWLPPLAAALDGIGANWEDWFLVERAIDLSAPPPEGVFYNRMSASSHTRGHRFSAELTAATLAWLTQHGRRVVNGPAALDLEISKVRQYAALARAGVATPRTVAVVGRERLVEAARAAFGAGSFILKPNRGGKGLGVRLFENADALAAHVASGGFELCPADVCEVPGRARPAFRVIPLIDDTLRARLERFLRIAGIEIAGIEFATGRDGMPLVYDVNTNTNYNASAEAAAEIKLTGMRAIANFLQSELDKLGLEAA